jgi:hypothetical protein
MLTVSRGSQIGTVGIAVNLLPGAVTLCAIGSMERAWVRVSYGSAMRSWLMHEFGKSRTAS